MADFKDDMGEIQAKKALNGLEYEGMLETSIATTRTFKKQQFQKSVYGPGDEAVCDWNSGSEFVNARRSWLVFSVQTDLGTIDSYGRGSALNYIQRIVITTRSGVELSRTENLNLLACKLIRYSCPNDYLSLNGE